MNDTKDSVLDALRRAFDTLRAQLAEAQRELIAKESERAGLELERNNAQRQHTTQCAINKADSQHILELTAQLAEAQNEAATYRALVAAAGNKMRTDFIAKHGGDPVLLALDAERINDLDVYVRLHPSQSVTLVAGNTSIRDHIDEIVAHWRAAIDAAKGEPS